MNRIYAITRWIILGLELQFFLTLISFPILIYWGLPLSLASPLGNLLFTPCLTLYLLLSSIIFFLELFYLPNGLFIYFLEKLTRWWGILLNYGSYKWLISFVVPFKPLLLVAPCAACFIFFIPILKKSGIRCIYLMSVFIFSMLLFNTLTDPQKTYYIHYKNAQLILLLHNKELILIDTGVLARQKNYQSFVEFTLLPELNKRFGKTAIDYIVCLKPTETALHALISLCQCIPVKSLYLPALYGTPDKKYAQLYETLQHQLAIHQAILSTLQSYPLNIASFTIDVLPKKFHYKKIQFNHHTVLCQNGNNLRTDL